MRVEQARPYREVERDITQDYKNESVDPARFLGIVKLLLYVPENKINWKQSLKREKDFVKMVQFLGNLVRIFAYVFTYFTNPVSLLIEPKKINLSFLTHLQVS